MSAFTINRPLLPMKAHFFLYNGGTAPVVPFMPTYAKQLGFSSVVVGTLYTVLPIAGMVAKPLFGGIADRLKWHKNLFMLFLALTGILFFAINFTPTADSETFGPGVDLDCGPLTYLKSCRNNTDQCALKRLEVNVGNSTVECDINCPQVNGIVWNDDLCIKWGLPEYCKHTDDHKLKFKASVPVVHTEMIEDCIYFRIAEASFPEKSIIPYCNKTISTNHCQVKCNEVVLNEILIEKTEASARTVSFGVFAFLMLTSWVAMAVVTSVGDAICFGLLGSKPEDYGKQRVWGSIGWGIFSMLAGFLVDETSKGQTEKNYAVVFYMALVVILVDFFVCTKLQVTQTQVSTSIVRDMGQLISQLKINIFLIWCIIIGMCTAILWNFLFWHLEILAEAQGCDSLEWIKTLQGLVMGVQCFGGEVPFFFISGWVIRKMGHVHAMSMVLFGFGARFFLYYWLVNPWWVLPIELLNGLTFGIFYATMTSYASKVAPPGTEATVQGLVGAVFEGVGLSLGSLLGGILFQSIGGANTFLVFAIMSWVGFVLHVIVQHFVQKKQPTEWQQQQEEVKEFAMTPMYASPQDAIQMLDYEPDSFR